ncbi:15-hydroxyprostaglandin dehydrogenase [NAD(+)]-like [Zerene cesonia]|uniref:15-hydroxyprostaglandin dehydrogenase [NAD(+)]-like n=1 Tax=Zerene cesonia TaxID=33412 RepID=UPI0018E4E2CC|nr:15-hydroxyprostaglandin dehydrogenase [NAD(+)]-like [Zerene cesonia]
MHNLNEKIIFVTGGANGIGKSIVQEFLKYGAKVAFLDIDENSGIALEAELKSTFGDVQVMFIRGDVTIDDDLFGAYDKILKEYGTLDVLVNNAGIADESPSMYKKEIEINFTATVTSTLKALEIMREDLGGRGGTIINISSIVAVKLLSPDFFIYAATKTAVLHFSNCIGMIQYYQRTKVRVIAVCLGGTQSDLHENARMFDNTITMDEIIETYKNFGPSQTSAVAAKGIIESYINGESGSTWLVNSCKITDISANIREGYMVMGQDADA